MFKRYILGSGLIIQNEFTFLDTIVIRPVRIPTSHIELQEYAEDQITYGFLCALSEKINFELEVVAGTEKGAAISEWNHQWLLILISIVLRSPIHFPLRSTCSASLLQRGCIRTGQLMIFPSFFREAKHCSQLELEKVRDLYSKFSELLSDRAFSHAASVAALNFNYTQQSMRMISIWSAIEALIGVDHELSYRIPMICSLLLEKEREKRVLFFKSVQSLYNDRSRCVHGNGIAENKLGKSIAASQELLCQLIEWTCREGAVLSPQKAKELPLL